MPDGAGIAARPRLARVTIGVMGSGTAEHDDCARPLGELLAELGVNVLTGGGGGVMTAVSRAFIARRRDAGISIGILPCASEEERSMPKAGYPNPFIDLAIHTHLPYSGREGTHDLSRNHINVLTPAAIVALPGEDGTAAEIALTIRYAKPLVVFATRPELVRHFPEGPARVTSIDAVARFLRRYIEEP